MILIFLCVGEPVLKYHNMRIMYQQYNKADEERKDWEKACLSDVTVAAMVIV